MIWMLECKPGAGASQCREGLRAYLPRLSNGRCGGKVFVPVFLARSSSFADGRPTWKLTTLGRDFSSTTCRCSSKRAHVRSAVHTEMRGAH